MSTTLLAQPRFTNVPSPTTTAPTGALAALSLSMLLSSLGTSIANVGLPTLANVFAASFQEVQWVVLSYLLAITTLIVGVGRLGDVVGRRRLMLAGLVLFTTASALCGLAPDLGWLVAARGAQGLGAAVMMALTLAFAGAVASHGKTGRVMGLLGTMSAVGTALGPSLGGVVIVEFGWRAMFVVNVPLGLAALLLAWRHLPRDSRESWRTRERFDFAGMLLLALVLGAYALAMTLGRGDFGAVNVALLLGAALGLGGFVLVEARVASPLLSPAMFRDALLRASVAMSALVSTVMMTTLVVGPFYLVRALGLDAAATGGVLSVGPVVAALTGVPAGRLADRYGPAHASVGGLLVLAAGSLGLALVPASVGVGGYLVAVTLMTAGYAVFQAANNTAAMRDVRADQRGVVSGLLNLSRNLGLVTGASAMGAVFAASLGTADMTAAEPALVASAMRTTFAVATLLVVGALVVAFRRARNASKDTTP